MAPATGDPAAPAVIFFSSGSTGRPKGIVHSAANLVAIVASVRETWGLTRHDALFVAMPLAFVYACVVECLTPLSLGGTIVLQERFDPEAAVDLVARGRITVMMGVPNLYRALLDMVPRAGERGRLRVCATGGETLAPDLAGAFAARFGAPLVDFYGLTEAPHVVAPPPGTDPAARPRSCGRPVRGVEVAVVDDAGGRLPPGELGELILRAPWMFLGYFRDPEETARVVRGGWLYTGDLVSRDSDGYLTIVERRKALIKRSGFNVVPAEVEAVILGVAGVAEVAVVGVPDPRFGERVKAWVAPRAGAAVAAAEILAACHARLADYKVPDAIEMVAALSKGPTGKIARRDLRR